MDARSLNSMIIRSYQPMQRILHGIGECSVVPAQKVFFKATLFCTEAAAHIGLAALWACW